MIKKCILCSEEFIPVKKTTKYCSIVCSNKARVLSKDRAQHQNICEQCGAQFVSISKIKRFCSNKCNYAHEHEKRRKEFIDLICEHCGKIYQISKDYSRTRFCSNSCSRFDMHQNMAPEQKQNWKDKIGVGNTGKVFTEKRKEQYREMFRGSGNPRYGINLDDETRQKISESVRLHYTNNPVNKKYYTLICDFCKEPFENLRNNAKYCSHECCYSGLSDTMTYKIVNGEFEKYKNSYRYGSYWSVKMNKKIRYRSSWEQIVYGYFEDNKSIIAYKVEPYSIKYVFENLQHNYIPDVFVQYANGSQKLIEIKPNALTNAPLNLAKFAAAREYCKSRNITFEIWTEISITALTEQERMPHEISQ